MTDDSDNVIKIDCLGETCPIPLVETRKAIRKASPGDVIEVIGDHKSSMKEIPMAVEALGLELLSVEDKGNKWMIRIKIPKEKK
ncbi:MAG TPA: sulfurtransferase TusA family protein [Candidatus Bathyarchaeia archaeon]|nr:sulfurtransferase TusA family protein [Candidatus Bathyarchaeia archaeon]